VITFCKKNTKWPLTNAKTVCNTELLKLSVFSTVFVFFAPLSSKDAWEIGFFCECWLLMLVWLPCDVDRVSLFNDVMFGSVWLSCIVKSGIASFHVVPLLIVRLKVKKQHYCILRRDSQWTCLTYVKIYAENVHRTGENPLVSISYRK